MTWTPDEIEFDRNFQLTENYQRFLLPDSETLSRRTGRRLNPGFFAVVFAGFALDAVLIKLVDWLR